MLNHISDPHESSRLIFDYSFPCGNATQVVRVILTSPEPRISTWLCLLDGSSFPTTISISDLSQFINHAKSITEARSGSK